MQQKLEVKSVEASSMFKVTLYLMAIPLGLMVIVGIFTLIIGIGVGNTRLIVTFLPFIIMPIIMAGIYGLLGMLTAVIYNLFAGKFGGLEMTVKQKPQPLQTEFPQNEMRIN